MKKVTLYLPDALYNQLEAKAKVELRALSNYIVLFLLKAKLEEQQ